MHIRTGLLFLALFAPLTSFAAKGNFDFVVGGKAHVFASTCVKSIEYVAPNEVHAESLVMSLTDACGKRLATITHDNIGKKLTISYRGHELSTAMILSRIGGNFSISSKDIPRVVLMQVLDDYGVLRN